MTTEVVHENYIRWNVHLKGHDEQKKKYGYWYRGAVFFNESVAITRFVRRGRNQLPILLVKHGGLVHEMNHHQHYTMFQVPDIAVFSRYEDDMLPDEEMHERIRYIVLQQVREFTELTVLPMTDKLLAENSDSNSKNSYGASSLQMQMSRLYTQYDAYSQIFKLGWPSLPNMYREQLAETMRIKIDRWNEPTAMAKRTRAKARKLAVKALSADD